MSFQLAIFDVDSTLIQQEVIDLLASYTEHGAEVSKITEAAMRGQLDFDQALSQRVSLLEGLSESVFHEVLTQISFSNGAIELIKELKSREYKVGVVSGGFHNVIDLLVKDLHLDFVRANYLEVSDGIITGRTVGPIINRRAKAEALMEFSARHQINLENTIAIGDGSNDIEMIKIAGLGFSYKGKPALNDAADICITEDDLRLILNYL
ncbi:MAG: phosphoserine phosphatase SerB [Candidatus Nanopelagicaceae bacterium]|nr:phosphoserine phosphatase SerB [Candidatus Nanopelagicaceae bacterium]